MPLRYRLLAVAFPVELLPPMLQGSAVSVPPMEQSKGSPLALALEQAEIPISAFALAVAMAALAIKHVTLKSVWVIVAEQ